MDQIISNMGYVCASHLTIPEFPCRFFRVNFFFLVKPMLRRSCRFLVYWHGSIVGIASSIDSAALTTPPKSNLTWHEITKSLVIGKKSPQELQQINLQQLGVFLVGFGIGALFTGPLSEKHGRSPVIIGGLSLYLLCIMVSSFAPNVGSQLVFRFLAGFFASVPSTIGSAIVGDLWSCEDRMYTFPIFVNAA